LGDLVLESVILPQPTAEHTLPALLTGIRAEGAGCLPWNAAARALQARVLSLRVWEAEGHWPDLSDAALLQQAEHWLAPWLLGMTRLAELDRLNLSAILRATLNREAQQRLDDLAPESVRVPSGILRALTYQPGESPVLAVRLQEMFGQRETPRVCRDRIPVTLHLLSPARRPVQITQDLAGFWDRTYAEVRKEMRTRYPRHYWPENPREAVPTHRLRPPQADQ
jgi:ATP-dependent helicase HrpB